jgi:ADP-heptose:LPS heptosyltransferase
MTDRSVPSGLAPHRIVVFRALQLGDMLCAVPALRALRQAWPQARITLVGLPWAQSFADRWSDLVDDFMPFPGAVGFPEQAETDAHLPEFNAACRARRFDLAIQLHGSGGVANDIVAGFGARYNAGFLKPGEPPRAGCFIPWPDALHEIERYNALMRALGIDASDTRLSFPLTRADTVECDILVAHAGLEPDRLVLIHPGAQLPSRRWAPERFAEVADALAEDGWQIGITGTASESEITSAVLGTMQAPAIHLAGRTSLGALATLVGRAQLVVSNDTGMSHVAAAMRTPSVIVASGSDMHRWAPLDHALHQVLGDMPACRPCAYAVCPVGQICSSDITPDEVTRRALAGLRASQSAHPGSPFTLHETELTHAA